jgi:hypothetical protein
MPMSDIRLTRSRSAAGDLVVRLGVPLLDEYLEFLAGRCRPNTVLGVAYDLKVFFAVVAKPPRRVRPVGVLAFMTAQRTGGEGRLQQVAGAGAGGVSARTLRRRLYRPRTHPCQRVRPSTAYFAAGHRLLNCLTRPLPVRMPVQQRPDQDYLRAAISAASPAAQLW